MTCARVRDDAGVAAAADDDEVDACSFAVHARMFASTIFGSKTLSLNSCNTYTGVVLESVLAPELLFTRVEVAPIPALKLTALATALLFTSVP